MELVVIHSGKPLILVADDDASVLNVVKLQLEEHDYRVRCASDKPQLLKCLSEEEPVILLLDLRFGEEDGVQVLCELLQLRPYLCVVLFTAHASVETAVSAIKLGAFDYLTKPLDHNHFCVLVERAIEQHVLRKRLERLEKMTVERESAQPILGDSPAMNQVRAMISSVATTDATVLILGESGTGKELVARMLHDQSNRQQGPFVPVNMAALPRDLVESVLFGHEKGAFTGADKAQPGSCEMSHQGTLFLDEIGEMELSLQAKLLRFLQERTVQRVGSNKTTKVNVRVVAATNRDLQEHIREGRFREDLYYRLHVIPIIIPPLRERPGDIAHLATHFLERAAVRYHKNLRAFSSEALQSLVSYDWPGNIRQLENAVERIAILSKGPNIQREDLPPEVLLESPRPPISIAPPVSTAAGLSSQDEGLKPIEQMEKQAILDALRQTRGNVSLAAKKLGLGHATVYRKLKRYAIGLDDWKRSVVDDQATH
jgi:two-component system, NtrC family, response regulator HydG